MSRSMLAALVVIAFALNVAAQNPPAPASSSPAAAANSKAPAAKSGSTVDRAYLQSIWDGWASNDLEKQGQFYVQGPGHLFFDVAPLKYNSWDEYKAGVAPSLKDSPKVTYTVNDDMQIHPEGKVTWIDGTVTMQGASPQGEKQTLTLRWTAIFEQQDGRWLIQHEHVSAAADPQQQ